MHSVLEQTYSEIEYIVIDGGSTDGSKTYIESFKESLAYWVSESDKGIYNAMNKGIEKATGDYLLFLNSGDCLTVTNVIESLQPLKFSQDFISCGLRIVGDNIDYVKAAPEEISFSFLFKNSLPHPATFIKREIFIKYDNYDENLKVVSDWKFFILAICKNKATYEYIPKVLSSFNLYGFSSIEENSDLLKKEREIVLIEEFEPFYKDWKEVTKINQKISALKQSRWIKILLKLGLINKF
jgi:glycosyltransferase involved in cell wall biosynthesis